MSSNTRNQPSRLRLITALVISLSITAGSIFFIFYRLTQYNTTNTGTAIINSDSYFSGGTVLDPPRQLDDFTLAGIDGNPLSLSDLAGKVTVLHFGYTNCPDVCPITMGNFKRIKGLLTTDADQVNFLMISVDGSRDNPVRMREYLGNFDPDFLGMTGAEQEVSGIGVDFGLYFATNHDSSELVDHTSSVFMVDQQGRLHTIFPYGTQPIVIAESIKALLA